VLLEDVRVFVGGGLTVFWPRAGVDVVDIERVFSPSAATAEAWEWD
jgi:hypothetical protein